MKTIKQDKMKRKLRKFLKNAKKVQHRKDKGDVKACKINK